MGKFKNILIYTKKNPKNSCNQPNICNLTLTCKRVIELLSNHKSKICLDLSCEELLPELPTNYQKFTNRQLADLIMIIGGDGTFLQAIRENIDAKIPFLGINQGRLGFLADLNPENLAYQLPKILAGQAIKEPRSLLQATIIRENQEIFQYIAVNDIVLYNEKIPKLIEFQILIDQTFLLQQRADGLVITTPTGSTAYALSAGGPILSPSIRNFALVPLYPHTLSSRPIVINEHSLIELKILPNQHKVHYGLNFDGQVNFRLDPKDQIFVKKYPIEAMLLHSKEHDYFKVLREKLGWNK